MNPDLEKQLEAIVSRELKQLPELEAPRTLLPRVLAAIEQRAALPWYRRAWQTWPVALQVASFVLLTAMIGGLAFVGWDAAHAASVSAALLDARQWLAGFGVFLGALEALAQAVVVSVKHLGPVFLGVCLMAGLAAYVSCLGLGAAFVRLAFSRR